MSSKNEGRKVDFKHQVWESYSKNEPSGQWIEVLVKNAVFLDFGIDFTEFEMGAASYSTAIIELKDGSVKNIPVEDIIFKN